MLKKPTSLAGKAVGEGSRGHGVDPQGAQKCAPLFFNCARVQHAHVGARGHVQSTWPSFSSGRIWVFSQKMKRARELV